FEREVKWAIEQGAPISLGSVTSPCRLRSVRTPRWKYVRYFDPSGTEPDEWEFYDLLNDPIERHNLMASRAGPPALREAVRAWGTERDEREKERARLHALLLRYETLMLLACISRLLPVGSAIWLRARPGDLPTWRPSRCSSPLRPRAWR